MQATIEITGGKTLRLKQASYKKTHRAVFVIGTDQTGKRTQVQLTPNVRVKIKENAKEGHTTKASTRGRM